jgi:PPOX class probable F420-dependent enzyme
MALSDALKQLLDEKIFVHLATVMEDGSPQVSPVWVNHNDEFILINSAKGRLKDLNIRRDARVGLSITHPDNVYQFTLIRGLVEEITEAGAGEHIDALAKKYMGVDHFERPSDQVRVIYKIRATHINNG